MPSAKVLILYATDYGNTQKMAQAVLTGAKSVAGTSTLLKTAEEATSEDLIEHDALILGTPVHMGSPDWRIKKFIDTVCSNLWMKDKMVGKVAAVFASGGGFGSGGGGCELAMLALFNNFAELGMIMVPLPKNTPGYQHAGIQWGPYGRSGNLSGEPVGITTESLEAAMHHGANVARIAAVLKGQTLFTVPQAAESPHR